MKTWEFTGTCSTFGGPLDRGVSPSEDLALYERKDIQDAPPGMFLDRQPAGTTGSARRLNVNFPYIAMRWAYNESQVSQDAIVGGQNVGRRLPVSIGQKQLREIRFTITNPKTNKHAIARACDFGPNEVSTHRLVDCSDGLLAQIGAKTNDTLVVSFVI